MSREDNELERTMKPFNRYLFYGQGSKLIKSEYLKMISVTVSTSHYLLKIYVIIYVSERFACLYVHAPCVCLVSSEVRRGYWIPSDWSYRWL